MLNRSNNLYCFHYCKQDPTTWYYSISNATACLYYILYVSLSNLYCHWYLTDNCQKSENEQWIGHIFHRKGHILVEMYSIPVLRKMCTKYNWFWLTPNLVSYLVDAKVLDLYLHVLILLDSFNFFTECPCKSNCIVSFSNKGWRQYVA